MAMLTTWLCSPVSFAHNSYGKFSAKNCTTSLYSLTVSLGYHCYSKSGKCKSSQQKHELWLKVIFSCLGEPIVEKKNHLVKKQGKVLTFTILMNSSTSSAF